MAGDWIKVENVTPDKPEVFAIAEHLGIDPDAVLGKLIRIWVWADQQTYSGNAATVTLALLDRVAGVNGFGKSLLEAGWLRQQKRGLVFPNFDRHNGQSAKQRGLTARRVAKTRAKKANDPIVTSALAREEKRREEKKEKKEKKEAPPKAAVSVAFDPLKTELPPQLDTPCFRSVWSEWARHRIEIKAKLTPTSVKQQLAEFAEWGERRAIAAIRHTIKKGWRGIREPDGSDGKPATPAPAPLPILGRPT
uniref:Uncharacterized protein n=1 Tax=viral metagenome TaxID=1070528 RepID=A0A6M3L5Y7_9ZZZZ